MKMDEVIEKFDLKKMGLAKEDLQPCIASLGEEINTLIPKYKLVSNTITLPGVLLISDTYMIEIRLENEKRKDFDIIRRDSIGNIRYSFGSAKVVIDGKSTDIDTSRVQLVHENIAIDTDLGYYGTELEEWLSLVTTSFPASLL